MSGLRPGAPRVQTSLILPVCLPSGNLCAILGKLFCVMNPLMNYTRSICGNFGGELKKPTSHCHLYDLTSFLSVHFFTPPVLFIFFSSKMSYLSMKIPLQLLWSVGQYLTSLKSKGLDIQSLDLPRSSNNLL